LNTASSLSGEKKIIEAWRRMQAAMAKNVAGLLEDREALTEIYASLDDSILNDVIAKMEGRP
jgi:hypothetical protein